MITVLLFLFAAKCGAQADELINSLIPENRLGYEHK